MWDWIKEQEGSWLLPIHLPKNFEEYLGLLWEHTSSTYLSLMIASILLSLLTLTFNTRRLRSNGQKDPSQRSFHEEISGDDVDVNDANIIGRIKKAQSRVISKKIEENMSQDEVEEEYEIQQKQLSQIYSLLKEHEKEFGPVSMEDLKGQMNLLYKD